MRAWMCLAPLALAACAGNYQPQPLTEKQTAEMDKALAGLVPGEKVNCINREPQTNFTVISGNTLLYRVNRKLVYKNDLIGSCAGLARGDTMIVRTWGSQYCRGDITTSADLMTGINTGSCALGDFTPYRAPAK
ncbi:hypothetical protein PMI04_000795 [Sphingobium sp. AP49]|uniref:hypothetical protein n=1 Tax=Sphingobium sp. AP49 TaxID=1144307 RepID=UPI00026EDCF7|nr:hypothetical protein [Sphingobium sp. AP49]WHO39172.1 hypothetical protein PMI04_000795 [Sphingobium sp. AP49]